MSDNLEWDTSSAAPVKRKINITKALLQVYIISYSQPLIKQILAKFYKNITFLCKFLYRLITMPIVF